LSRARSVNGQAVCEATVIAAYSAARAQGCARYEAFVRAVQAYREQFANLPANLAGSEVAAILRATRHISDVDDDSEGLRHAAGMEYVGPARG
jgi:hypothetical protein